MTGTISCSGCGREIAAEDVFCGYCGLRRDRGSDVTLRSTDPQAPTEPGTSLRGQKLRQRTEKASHEGVGNRLPRLGRSVFRRQQAQAQPRQPNKYSWWYKAPRLFWNLDKDLPDTQKIPSKVLWFKAIVVFGFPLVVLVIVWRNIGHVTSATADANGLLALSFPTMVMGFTLVFYCIVTFTKTLMADQDYRFPDEFTPELQKLLVLGIAGAVDGFVPYLLVSVSLRASWVPEWLVWGSIWGSYTGIVTSSIFLYFVGEKSKKTSPTYVPLLLWVQYLCVPGDFLLFIYLWSHKITNLWGLEFFSLFGLSLLGALFVGIGHSQKLWPKRHTHYHMWMARLLLIVELIVLGLGIGIVGTPMSIISADTKTLLAMVLAAFYFFAGIVQCVPLRYYKEIPEQKRL